MLRFGAPIVLRDTTFSDNRPARCRKISQAQPLGEGANAVAPLVLDARQTLGSCPCSLANRAVGFGHGPRWQEQRGVRRGNQPWHTIAFGRIDVLFAQNSAAEPVDKAGIIVPAAGDCRYPSRRSRLRPCQRISSRMRLCEPLLTPQSSPVVDAAGLAERPPLSRPGLSH